MKVGGDLFSDFDYLAVAVIPAMRADTVLQLLALTVGTRSRRDALERVVSASFARS